MINVKHLSKQYGPHLAVDDLSFDVNAGEIVGFLGPNGAGKSTTMKILTGFMPATGGSAQVAGYDVFQKPLDVKKNVGYLPETPPVYTDMTVNDYLDFAARIHLVPKAQIGKAISAALEKTSLGDVRKRLIGNLSKGYRQRVGLAQALIHNPKVLILDEPTVGLDPKQIIEIRQLIKSLGGDHTVILSSHILPEVTATCQRIIVISKGKIVAEDTFERLIARTQKGRLFNLYAKNLSEEGLQALRSVNGVRAVSRIEDRAVIELQADAQEIRDVLIETAVQKKMGVLEFSAEKVSLEEIFLQLTTVE